MLSLAVSRWVRNREQFSFQFPMRKIPPPYTDPTSLFRHGGAPPGLLDFSASINPLGPPQSVLRAIKEGLADIGRYPDPDCRELTDGLAAGHKVEPSQIVIGNGSNELIYAIARAVRPKRVAIAEPTYTEYLRASLLVGAEVNHWLAEGNQFQFKPFDPQGADVVWLCNPNNPTGGMWPSAACLARWMKAHPRTTFVVDEAFLPLWWMNFVCARRYPVSMIHQVPQLANLVVLRSFTKMYAFPGLRLGYAVAQTDLAERLRGQMAPWSVNALALRAGIAALDDRDYWLQTGDWLMNCRRVEFHTPTSRWHPVRSQASFMLLRLEKMISSRLSARLRDCGIAIRDASNFVGLDQRFVRVAFRTPAENARLLEALQAVLAPEGKPCSAP